MIIQGFLLKLGSVGISLNSIKALLAILLFGLQISCNAQNNNETAKLSLDGTWDIIFDDENKGIEQDWFLDENFEEIATDVEPIDRLNFKDVKKYKDRLTAAQKATGEKDALISGCLSSPCLLSPMLVTRLTLRRSHGLTVRS